MDACISEFFQEARSRVTEQDIRDFSPSDPGYGSYVEVLLRIRSTGVIPELVGNHPKPHLTDHDITVACALSEPVSMSAWVRLEPDAEPLPANARKRRPWIPSAEQLPGFLRFRRFTSAVALMAFHEDACSDLLIQPHYVACNLLTDLDRRDPDALARMRTIFAATRAYFRAAELEETFPFFTFGMLVLSQWAGDWPGAEQAATLLIEDDRHVRTVSKSLGAYFQPQHDGLLFGLTNGTLSNDLWLRLATELRNPNRHKDLQLVIDAMTA